MTERHNPVDPPDFATWQTARRLMRLWREQWRLAGFGQRGRAFLQVSAPG